MYKLNIFYGQVTVPGKILKVPNEDFNGRGELKT